MRKREDADGEEGERGGGSVSVQKSKTTVRRKSRGHGGETRVKDEDTGGGERGWRARAREPRLARILISSTAHQPLAESRSFAHFISRPAERGGEPTHRRRRLRQIGKLQGATLPPATSTFPCSMSRNRRCLARSSRKSVDIDVLRFHVARAAQNQASRGWKTRADGTGMENRSASIGRLSVSIL